MEDWEKQQFNEFITKNHQHINQILKMGKKVKTDEQRKCNCCGIQENITKDHIIPASVIIKNKLQGLGKKNNRQWLCKKCNSFKGSRIIPIIELRKEHYLHSMSKKERKKLKHNE